MAGFEDEGRDHEPRDAGGLEKLEKARKQIGLCVYVGVPQALLGMHC